MNNQHLTKLVRVSENNWQLFKVLKRFQKMTVTMLLMNLLSFT